jgi:tripartite-type tricarboxylate transporter receptor subunit TctC
MAVDAWFGLWAPARTPPEVIGRLDAALVRLLGEPEVVARLGQQGFTAAPMDAAAFAAFQREEVRRWQELVALTGIRIEG